MKDIISISDRAAKQIKKIVSEASESVLGVVVGVDKSGCSGYAYKLDYAKNENIDSLEIIESKGVKVSFTRTIEMDLDLPPRVALANRLGASAFVSIHTNASRSRGAKVNGKLVPLNKKLKSGDRVEILKSEKIKPSANWMDYATTARARSKIKSTLNAEKKNLAKEGKEKLRRKLKQLKLKLNDRTINELQKFFKLSTSLDLFYRVGINTIDNTMIKKFASSRSNVFISYIKNKIRRKPQEKEIEKEEITKKYDLLVFGNNEEKLDYTISTCCSPIPGDKVFGFITIKDGIKIHKKNCPNALRMQSNYDYRILKAKWIDSTQEEFTVSIDLTGIDKIGLLNNITNVISGNMNMNIRKLNFETDGGIFKGNITISVKTNNLVNKAIEKLKKLNGIEKVNRL